MNIPSTSGQLLVLLLFVMPGSVYQTVRTRLRGPIPADHDAASKILRALAVSTGLNAVYLTLFGSAVIAPFKRQTTVVSEDGVSPHLLGLWALVCLFLIPALLACFVFWLGRWNSNRTGAWLRDAWRTKLGLERLAYYPSPRTWDFAFLEQDDLWVRIKHADGTWTGGKYGRDSLVASYPEPLDVYLEIQWELDANGKFVAPIPNSKGVYVACEDAITVERFEGPTPPGYQGDAS